LNVDRSTRWLRVLKCSLFKLSRTLQQTATDCNTLQHIARFTCRHPLSTPTVLHKLSLQVSVTQPRSQHYSAPQSVLLCLNVSITQPQSKHYFASKSALLSLKISFTQPQRQHYSASKSAFLSLKVSITQPQSQFYSVSAYKSESVVHKKSLH